MELRFPSRPSISTSAEALAPNVPMPRTQNSERFFPGSPLSIRLITPATRPPRMLDMEVAGTWMSFVSTAVMAPTTLILRCVPPRDVTTTSSRTLLGVRVIFRSRTSALTVISYLS